MSIKNPGTRYSSDEKGTYLWFSKEETLFAGKDCIRVDVPVYTGGISLYRVDMIQCVNIMNGLYDQRVQFLMARDRGNDSSKKVNTHCTNGSSNRN
jgi:hypothetical protein